MLLAARGSAVSAFAPPASRNGGRSGRPAVVACRARWAADQHESPLQQAAVKLAAGVAAAAIALAPGGAWAESREAGRPLPALPSVPTQEFELGSKGQAGLFDPMAYAGRWFEVASLKKGFAGEGQQDCHCTQGIYVPMESTSGGIKLQVNTFCVHGGPDGRLSGIQGSVTCANPAVLELLPEFKSEMDRMEGIEAKCALSFDSLPFIPPEPYIVLKTDYTTFALVRGAKDRSFVQIYSRTPNPGPEFIAKQRATLAALSYPVNEIVDTPQDCPSMTPQQMMAVMNQGMSGAQLMPASTPPSLAMAGYDLGPAKEVVGLAAEEAPPLPKSGIAFDRLRNPLESLKNALTLFS